MKKSLVLLVLGLGFIGGLEAGTWTWKNNTKNTVTVTADFLGCSLTKGCVEPFDLAPGESKTLSKGAYMLSVTKIKNKPTDLPQASYSFSNIPGSFSDVTFTITADSANNLKVAKTSTGGVVSKVKLSFGNARQKAAAALASLRSKMNGLFSQARTQIGSLADKLSARIKKKSALEDTLKKQKQANDTAGQAKTQQQLETLNDEIKTIETQATTVADRVKKQGVALIGLVGEDVKTLKAATTTTGEKSIAMEEEQKLTAMKRSFEADQTRTESDAKKIAAAAKAARMAFDKAVADEAVKALKVIQEKQKQESRVSAGAA